MGIQTSTDHPASSCGNVRPPCVVEDVYDAAGLSIEVVNAVLLELIGQVHRYGMRDRFVQ
jgi:hypothetical protein